MIRLLSLLALSLMLSACHEEEDLDLDAPPAYCEQFSSSLTVVDRNHQQSDSFVQGEDIGMELAVSNDDSVSHSLMAPDGCGQVRFEVRDSDGALLWTSHDDQVCTQAAVTIDYAAGTTRTFTAIWDQQRRDGAAAAIGDYSVTALDRSECSARLTRSGSFSIQ